MTISARHSRTYAVPRSTWECTLGTRQDRPRPGAAHERPVHTALRIHCGSPSEPCHPTCVPIPDLHHSLKRLRNQVSHARSPGFPKFSPQLRSRHQKMRLPTSCRTEAHWSKKERLACQSASRIFASETLTTTAHTHLMNYLPMRSDSAHTPLCPLLTAAI